MPNFKTANRDGLIISYRNEEEFERIYEDVFRRNEYPFKTSKESPFILDCGSHIGITILYFKKLYPTARIIAFDPNPRTLELLKLNIRQNRLDNVEIMNVAISNNDGQEDFYLENKDEKEPTWGDSLAQNKWYNPEKGVVVKVRTVKLSDFIKEGVDLIKLDVEGTEEKIIREIEPKMNLVQKIFMEYHGSSSNPDNDELRIIDILRKNEFDIKVNQGWKFIAESEIERPDPYWLSIYAEK